jgi:hypothetical protein
MSNTKELLQRARRRFPPPEGVMDRLVVLRDRRRRNERITAGVVALAITLAILAIFVQVRSLGKGGPPAHHPQNVFEQVHGWIVGTGSVNTIYQSGIMAVDPAASNSSFDPTRTPVLSTKGGLPLAWSSDGTELLIQRATGLYVLLGDGSEVRLTRGSGGSFSPDGTEVIYRDHLSIYRIAASGGTPQAIATGDAGSGTGYLSERGLLSPDGTTIAYVRVVDHKGRGIWLMNADGTGQREIVGFSRIVDLFGKAEFLDGGGAWSPDGTQLAFATLGLGVHGDNPPHVPAQRDWFCAIFTVNADGTGLRRASLPGVCDNFQLSWSPDGSRIAVASFQLGLITMNPDGTDVREVPRWLSWPLWNPVG